MSDPFAAFAPRRSSTLRRAAGEPWTRGLTAALVLTASATILLLRIPGPERTAAGTALLQIDSNPPGAAIRIDGQHRGHTPATLMVADGHHRVTLHLDEYAEGMHQIHVEAGQTAVLSADLWLRSPAVQRLRPPLPGAALMDVSFLKGGDIVLTAAPSSRDERQLWLADGHGNARRLGPTVARGSVVVTPDGGQIAYLAGNGAAHPGSGRLTEVWIAAIDAGRGERRWALPADATDEHLSDLSWAPSGDRLLVISRETQSGASLRTHLRLLHTATDAVQELATLPSQTVPGSVLWHPNGRALALLARTDHTVALCLLDLDDGSVHYLADLGREHATHLSVPPLAWSPDGHRMIYAAQAEDASSGGLFRQMSPPRLFAAEHGAPLGRPLGTATGHAPVWCPDGGIVTLARTKRDGPWLLQLITPDGDVRNLAALPIPAAGTPAVRWDLDHAQAIVALHRPFGSGASATDYWLVRFRPEVAP